MEKHVQILGGLYIAFSILGILLGALAFILIAGGGFLSGDRDAIIITSFVGGIIGVFLVVTSIIGIIGGMGLLKHKAWARILVLVLSFLNLLNVPFGTLLGIYGIWVLFNEEVTEVFV